MFGEEARKGLAVLIGMNLRAEDVMQVLVLEHGGRNRRRNPEDLLLLLDLRGERDRVRACIDPADDVDLFLVDEAFGLVDRNVGLALGIGGDRSDLVLAADATLLVDEIDCNLRTDGGGDRAAGRKRTGQVVDYPKTNGFSFRPCTCPIEGKDGSSGRGIFQQRSARSRHDVPPETVSSI